MPTPAELLPATTRIGRVRLAVSNLARSLQFYTLALGFRVRTKTESFAVLTPQDSEEVLLELQQLEGIRPVVRATRLGLYHYALLLPTRSSLASIVEHLHAIEVPFGSSDHLVSEALYLADPDGIQIEIYADRPRSQWTYRHGEIELAGDPLRFGELLAIPHPVWTGMPAATTLGHMHFYVSDLERARRFYCDGLGFEIAHSSYSGVLFISAGGYHHHVGLNTWAKTATPILPTDARLLSWELLLEDDGQVECAKQRLQQTGISGLTDPWGSQVVLTSRTPDAASTKE